MGFGRSVDFACDAVLLRLAGQSRLEAFFDEPSAHPFHSAAAHIEGFRDLPVLPSVSVGAGIGLEEDLGMTPFVRGELAFGNHSLERRSFVVGQRNNIQFLGHERTPFVTNA